MTDGEKLVELCRRYSDLSSKMPILLEEMATARRNLEERLNPEVDPAKREDFDYMYKRIELQYDLVEEFIRRGRAFKTALEAAVEGFEHELREIGP